MEKNATMPILVPVEPAEFWQSLRLIVREEMTSLQAKQLTELTTVRGLVEKPLYKMHEVCQLFSVSRRTVYDWIGAGRLHPVKVRSRVYFLGAEINRLMSIT